MSWKSDCLGRYAIWGFAIFPHILRKWYKLLDSKIVGNSIQAACCKTYVNILIILKCSVCSALLSLWSIASLSTVLNILFLISWTILSNCCAFYRFIDQAFFPLPILSSFYIFLSALEGKTDSLRELLNECGKPSFSCEFSFLCFEILKMFSQKSSCGLLWRHATVLWYLRRYDHS